MYDEPEGFAFRVNELKNNVRTKVRDKSEILPQQKTNRIKKEYKSEFMKTIGLLLDMYAGKKRLRIPEKAEKAYILLTDIFAGTSRDLESVLNAYPPKKKEKVKKETAQNKVKDS